MAKLPGDGGGSRPLTPEQIYAVARAAGFTWSAAVTATAISLGESGGDPDALGDTTITTATWGPSVGLMQVRSLKADKGTGRTRDETKLRDPLFNMKAAYSISAAGVNWTPWSVYTSGKYKQYLARAQGARLSQDPVINNLTAKGTDWKDILIAIGINTATIIGPAVGGSNEVAGAVEAVAASPLAAAAAALGVLGKAGAWMADSHNWARVALVVAGSAGVLAGLAMLAKSGASGGAVGQVVAAGPKAAKAVKSAATKAATTAAKVVPAGKAAGAAAKAAKAVK